MRALFFGTPEFAVPPLEALHEIVEIAAVVCQPDRAVGRGLELAAPAVKKRALELGLTVHQPTKVRTPDFAEWVRAQNADVALVVAYGRILPLAILQAPRLGCVNVHGSLLPKYRGAAPIQWSVINGEKETGVCLMQMDEGMDTGDMLTMHALEIGGEETSGELAKRLSELARKCVQEDLPRFLRGELPPIKQDHSQATEARLLEKSDGLIPWKKTAPLVHSHIRGMHPWPGAFTKRAGKTLKVHAARVFEKAGAFGEPGKVLAADKSRVIVACGDGSVELVTVQSEGKKPMKATDVVLGRGLAEGDLLE